MAEDEEVVDPIGSARDHVVIRGATLDTHFELGQIPVAGGTSYSSIIAVAELDSKLVVHIHTHRCDNISF